MGNGFGTFQSPVLGITKSGRWIDGNAPSFLGLLVRRSVISPFMKQYSEIAAVISLAVLVLSTERPPKDAPPALATAPGMKKAPAGVKAAQAPGERPDPPVVSMLRMGVGVFRERSETKDLVSNFVPPAPNPTPIRSRRLP